MSGLWVWKKGPLLNRCQLLFLARHAWPMLTSAQEALHVAQTEDSQASCFLSTPLARSTNGGACGNLQLRRGLLLTSQVGSRNIAHQHQGLITSFEANLVVDRAEGIGHQLGFNQSSSSCQQLQCKGNMQPQCVCSQEAHLAVRAPPIT